MADVQAEDPIVVALKSNTGLIGSLANTVGAPEPALRILLSVFAGYPIAALYQNFIVHQNCKMMHHLFFASCGLATYYFNYGWDMYHSIITVLVTYALTTFLRQSSQAMLTINFVFHMGYLLIGYYFTETGEYDILWTMPQCVLALRMIGYGFDVADGLKPKEKLSKDQKENALPELPSLLQLFAFAFFPVAFLVGPQFPFTRYKRFIDGEFRQHAGSVEAGLKRLGVGLLYLAVQQIGAMWLPDDYFLSAEFREHSFSWRIMLLGFWAKFALYKYISCWLIAEGALMCMGFTYAGKTETGENDWSGCSNVKLVLLETGNTMGHYVQSFNVNTNQWVAQYIYKRLKFMNNRNISYGAALGFLAVWHGFHTGYYMSFFIEYSIVTVEKKIETFYNKDLMSNYGNFLQHNLPFKCLKFMALKLYNLIYMGWCLTPFIFLSYKRWLTVFSAIHYFGFVYVLLWLIVLKGYRHMQKSNARQQEDRVFGNATTLSPTVSSSSAQQHSKSE